MELHALVAKTGEQWPATGQSIEPNMPLFPGYCADGQKRCWDKPISARAYLGKIHEAARSLTQGKTAASAILVKHAFQDFTLHKLGTHSMKKTVVSLMAEAAVSWSIISGVTGQALRSSFHGVIQGITSSKSVSPTPAQVGNFCGHCGGSSGEARAHALHKVGPPYK